jgi:hypothetical protein
MCVSVHFIPQKNSASARVDPSGIRQIGGAGFYAAWPGWLMT